MTDSVRSGRLRCSDAARWTVAGGAAGGAAENGAGAAGVAGASPVICRSGMAGRRAAVSGGAMRCGRTAAGRDGGRTAAPALFPGPSVGRAGAGWAPARSTESAEAEGPDVRAEFDELAELPEPDERAEPDEPDEPDELAEPTESDGAEEPDESADPAADRAAEPDLAAFADPDPAPDRAAPAGPDEPAVPDAAARPGEAAERDT
ncbi:hypothetical protein ACFC36_14185 [Streptomyces rubiginosohelvolus]|uniref:hypothetical protein n=1 Tax=Streptomyces rubiginosohelvolus TaxID=67362 RepID=UPI0035DEEA12